MTGQRDRPAALLNTIRGRHRRRAHGPARGPGRPRRGRYRRLAGARGRDPTFLLERLGSECTDLQFLRELTVSGLDAIAALPAPADGRVLWDLDWARLEASGGRVRKLSVTDTGTGVTAEQLRYFINQLAASGREQSGTANFGVGAKVAAGSRNPTDRNTAPGTKTKAGWCGSCATPTGLGDCNHSNGPTVTPTSGACWRNTTSRGCYAAGRTGPRSCCSATTNASTPHRRPRASPKPPTLDRPLPQHPLPSSPRSRRGPRPRARRRSRHGQLRRIHGERDQLGRHTIAGRCGRAERRDRALVGTRRGSPRPPARSERLGVERSRHGGQELPEQAR
jgi:hypothetical protein